MRREDGSWLVDGGMGIEQLKTALDIDAAFPGEADNAYRTLAGLVMHCLQRVPSVSDHFELDGWRFEVVDMDRTRIDKVLVMRPSAPPA
ncbi:transporter associated domain-containing protein [Azotobacter vinelandii]